MGLFKARPERWVVGGDTHPQKPVHLLPLLQKFLQKWVLLKRPVRLGICPRYWILNFVLVSAGIWILKLNIATGVLHEICNIQIFSCFYLVRIWFDFYFIESSCSLSSNLIFCYSNVISVTSSCINSTLFINKMCVPTTQKYIFCISV